MLSCEETDSRQVNPSSVAQPITLRLDYSLFSQTEIAERETVRCLEIGPGIDHLEGFETLDVISRPGTTYVAEWGCEPLPIPSETYDLVFASHVLEHVSWTRTQNALLEAKRVLKPHGILEVWVPNFAYIVECYLRNICGDEWRRENPEADSMKWVNGRIFTYGPGAENRHRACFDERFLRGCLEKAGFGNVQRSFKAYPRHRTRAHRPRNARRQAGGKGRVNFVSHRQLIDDVRDWSNRLPDDLVAVAGVPRSGLLPALHLALHRNIHLVTLEELAAGERPWQIPLRRFVPAKSTGRVLIVDDSLHSGQTLHTIRARFPDTGDFLFESGLWMRIETLCGRLYLSQCSRATLFRVDAVSLFAHRICLSRFGRRPVPRPAVPGRRPGTRVGTVERTSL